MESLLVEGSNQVQMPGRSRYHGAEELVMLEDRTDPNSEAASIVESRNSKPASNKHQSKSKSNSSPFFASRSSASRRTSAGFAVPVRPAGPDPRHVFKAGVPRSREPQAEVVDVHSSDDDVHDASAAPRSRLDRLGLDRQQVEDPMVAGPSTFRQATPVTDTPPPPRKKQTARRSGRLPPLPSAAESRDAQDGDNGNRRQSGVEDRSSVCSPHINAPPSSGRITRRTSSGTSARVPDQSAIKSSASHGGGEPEDEPESIEQFPSSPLEAPSLRRSVHGQETNASTPAPIPLSLGSGGLAKRKDRMQKRDGTVPQRGDPNDGIVSARSSRPPLSSSKLSLPNRPAAIEICYADDGAERLVARSMTILGDKFVLSDGEGKRAEILFSSILVLDIFADEVPTLRLGLGLSRPELEGLSNLRRQFRPEFTGSALYVLLRDEQSCHLAVEALEERLGRNKVRRPMSSERANFMSCLKAAEHKPSTAYAETSTARQKAAQAAERRQQQMPQGPQAPPSNDRGPSSKGKGKALNDDKQAKLSFNNAPVRRSTRSTRGKPSTVYAEYNDSADTFTGPPLHLDKDDVLFPYPPEGRTELTLTKAEKYRIQDQDFLNDVALEFGLRYTVDTKCSAELRSSVYLFSSYFYDKLSRKDKASKPVGKTWPAYNTVKKWTKSVNIFEKNIIIVPINESLHWYTAVIINPQNILKGVVGRDFTAQAKLSKSTGTSVAGSAAASDAGSGSDKARVPPTPSELNDQDSDDLLDELDLITNMEDGAVAQGVGMIGTSMDRMSINGNERQSSPPRPISSATYNVFLDQITPGVRTRSASTSPRKTSPGNPVSTKKQRVDVDVLNSESTYILTFDSLGSEHPAVGRDLERWLWFEAWDKLNISPDHDLAHAQYLEAKVPTQPNFSDCGVYLIHYVDCLLTDLKGTLDFVGRVPPTRTAKDRGAWEKEMQRVWRASDTGKLRAHWVDVIDEQTAKWNSLVDMAPQRESVASLPKNSQASVVLATQQPTAAPIADGPSLSTRTSPERSDHRLAAESGGAIETGASGTSINEPQPSRGLAEQSPSKAVDPHRVSEAQDDGFNAGNVQATTAYSPPVPYQSRSTSLASHLAEAVRPAPTEDDRVAPSPPLRSPNEPSPFDGLGSSAVPHTPAASTTIVNRNARISRPQSLMRPTPTPNPSERSRSVAETTNKTPLVQSSEEEEEEEEQVEARQIDEGLVAGERGREPLTTGSDSTSGPASRSRTMSLRTSPLTSPPPTSSSPVVARGRSRAKPTAPGLAAPAPARTVHSALTPYRDSPTPGSRSNGGASDSKKRSAGKSAGPARKRKARGPADSSEIIEISD